MRNILTVLVLGQLVNAAFGPAGLTLNMTGHEGAAARILLISGVATLSLTVLGASVAGALGVAIAVSAGLAGYNLWLYVTVLARTRLDPSIISVLSISNVRRVP